MSNPPYCRRMAFHHVALFRWNPGTSTEQVEAVTAALRALAPQLQGCTAYACGAGLGLYDFSADYGVIASFTDRSAWDAYMANAEHDRIRAELILPIVAERQGIQFAS